LTGANIYTGNTAINGGALIVNGSIASPSTFVNPGGRLGGIGVIGGNVLNRGVVEPGNTPSGLTVKGNYTQASDGNLRINIASNTTYGKLNVNGAASLSGSVTAVGVNGFKPKRGDSFRFLTAAGGVSGRFDALHSNFAATGTILQLGLTYEPNAVLLEFQQGSFADFAAGLDGFNGLTRNQKSVAKALDKVLFDKRERRLIDYLNGRSLSDLPGDFDRIAPEELGSIFETGISLANVQNTNIQRRNDDLRNGANGFSSAGMAMQGSGPGYSGPLKFRTGVAGPTGSEGKQSKTIYDPAPDNRWGVFLTGVGEWVDVGGNGNARGYDIRTGGFTFGVDYKVTPNFAFGVSAGYAGTGADLTNGGRVLINGGKLGLYATYFTGGFYMDAAATGGYNSYDTKRRSIQGTARGDTEGGEFNALIGGGYDIKAGNWSFGPTANVQYTYVGIDDYREHGSLAPLQIQRQNAESLRTAVGFRTSYNITLRNGLIIRPEVRAAWQHEFGDRNFEIASRFASGAGSTFNVNGPETGRDSLLLGAGVALQFNEYLSIYLYYDGQVARTDYESHNVSGGVRIAY
jgi:outer membrane autotransporter protein